MSFDRNLEKVSQKNDDITGKTNTNTKAKAKARVRFSMLLVFIDWLRFIFVVLLRFIFVVLFVLMFVQGTVEVLNQCCIMIILLC